MTGPFYNAGYTGIWIEGKSVEKLTPDIFGLSEKYFAICDISMSSSKGEQMIKYEECSPTDYIEDHVYPIEGSRESAGAPFLITDELAIDKYPGYNLIQVYAPGDVTAELIIDKELKEAFKKWTGFPPAPPSFNFSAVPESTENELKHPLASILLQASLLKRPMEFSHVVEELLGDIYISVSDRGKRILFDKIFNIIKDLSKSEFFKSKIIITPDGGAFNVTIDGSTPGGRLSITNKINKWLKIKPIETYFDESYRPTTLILDDEEDDDEEDDDEEDDDEEDEDDGEEDDDEEGDGDSS